MKYETGILKENVREYLLTLVQKFAQINTKALFTKRSTDKFKYVNITEL